MKEDYALWIVCWLTCVAEWKVEKGHCRIVTLIIRIVEVEVGKERSYLKLGSSRFLSDITCSESARDDGL